MQTMTNSSQKAVLFCDGFLRQPKSDKAKPFYLNEVFNRQYKQSLKPQQRLNSNGKRKQCYKKRFRRYLQTYHH